MIVSIKRQYCSPGAQTQDTALMYIGFMEDDYNQKESIRTLTSNVNSYYLGDWTYLFIFFYNLCMCLKGEVSYRHYMLSTNYNFHLNQFHTSRVFQPNIIAYHSYSVISIFVHFLNYRKCGLNRSLLGHIL